MAAYRGDNKLWENSFGQTFITGCLIEGDCLMEVQFKADLATEQEFQLTMHGALKLKNWPDQWKSGKLGTKSHVQSFPHASLLSTDISILLLNQPGIVMVGIRGQQGMPSQLYMPLLAFPLKLGQESARRILILIFFVI